MTRIPVLALLLASSAPRAEIALHPLFGDHMVLQQGITAPVWGTAAAGEEVTVSIAGQRKSARAGADGRWQVKLDPMKPGGPHEMTIGTVTLKNVMVGEVWVCSGQSNMEWPVRASKNAPEEIAAAAFPQIRLFTVPKKPADTPQWDVAGTWKECSPESVPGFSAVGYFFGRELHKARNVPIGLIHTSWGGTAAELWTSRRVLEADPEFKPMIEQYEARMKAFAEASEKAKAEGKAPPKKPGPGPAQLYNGMIAPLLPYAIAGALWYQGESNAGRAKQYQKLFPAMIRNWRDDWGQGDFPFLFVQLANYMKRKPEPAESHWAALREAQTLALSLPKTGMAVIIDIGEEKDIHPRNKQDVGRRLALAARHVAYGEDLVYSGPMYDSMKVEGNKARISFKHAGGGLEARGGKLAGFSIAGEDKVFAWAEARIEGDTVVVWSDKVEKPAAVRYGWADNPECTLYNKEGLPAGPFRTDP
jgi:sialate O-acetylesterase